MKFKRGNPDPKDTLPPEFELCDENPDELYQRALELVLKTEPEPGLSLEAKLWAVMDLQLFVVSEHSSYPPAKRQLTNFFVSSWSTMAREPRTTCSAMRMT